jgi:hypothetical protein
VSREGTVFIAEDLATGEPYLFTGMFSAHWESDRDSSHRDGPEHLDLVADEPVPWQVRLPRWISRKRTEADVEQIRTALETDPAVSHVSIEVERGERVEAIVRFVLRARSHPDALRAASAVDDRLGERVPFPIDELPDSAGGAFVVYTGWNPYDDIRPG